MIRMARLMALISSITLFVHADDITLVDGTVYKNAKIISHTPSTATILYADGGVMVSLEKLPPILQKQLGYNPEAAASYQQKQKDEAALNQENLKYQAALKKYVMIEQRIIPREIAQVGHLGFKVIGTAQSATDFYGNYLGAGTYCKSFNYEPEHNGWSGPIVEGDSRSREGFFIGPSSGSSIKIPAGWQPRGKVYILGLSLTSKADEMIFLDVVIKGNMEDGHCEYCVPAKAFSIDEWKKAGSPQ